MKFKLKIENEEFEIEILETPEGVKVKVGQKEFFFGEREKIEEKTVAKVKIPKRNFEKREILAPITGEITKILVREGDLVKKGQTLILLSAMKMENEILAEKEGKVKKIFVKEGEKVEKNQTLIILE